MTALHTPSRKRLLLGTLAALVLLAAASAVAASVPITSEQFAPGWQAHSRPLFNLGPAAGSGQTSWYVPGTLPRGTYVLVDRDGDRAELIDGHQFTVGGDGARKIYMLLFPGYNNVEALPVADVPALKVRRGASSID
jgi:hypothetical protein